ncbi:hypothetical protein AALO_G00283220 [Alosa alosa]|uniref:Fork-head domain-containing protein n=1 Tax=Alosa alosa TaxID=278164 RepID=A0AAV6FRW7_9TELE|nr:forkhead box protein J1-A [Alosa alosa]KAG5263156.1 hypothetical protein AALO_G00283220 [Alosa alosa]
MLSMSCVDPWPEGSIGLEEEVVTAAAQAEELDQNPSPTQSGPAWSSSAQDIAPCCPGGGTAPSSISSSLCLDDSLTSLQWLQEFSIVSAPHVALSSHHQGPLVGIDAPSSPLAGDPATTIGTPLTPGKPTAASFYRAPLPCLVTHGHCPDEVDYKSNPHVKPPYSYATLICMAMQASQKAKITLSCIYSWITDNFCYFRHADPTWQNSIRHNLSLNKCFIKVPRQKDEPGKGGFWKIDPQYAERLLSGAYKKRRMPPVRINPALQARLRLPATSTAATSDPATSDPTTSGGGLPGVLSVSPESQLLLQEFEEATTGLGRTRDPHLTEAAVLWGTGRGVSGGVGGAGGPRGRKRKQLGGARTSSKAPRRSSSPLLSTEEQRELGALKGSFDWDALLDSALNGELSLDEGGPLSPIPPHHHDQRHDDHQELAVHGTHIGLGPLQAGGGTAASDGPRGVVGGVGDLEEETYLATAFLQDPWPEEEEVDGGATRVDFLCSSTVNIEQLFDLGDSLGGDISSKIESLL